LPVNHLVSKNNSFLKSLIVRLSEARDVSDHGNIVDRYRLTDHMKDMLATPPNTLRVNEKYINEYYILNRAGMIVTTNYRDALILPFDDRRHYVTFSERRGEEFPKEFWNEFWSWYENGGFAHVAALLYQRNLSNFDPKAEPPKTPALRYMVMAGRGSDYSELADIIDELKNPTALTINELSTKAPGLDWLRDLTKRKATSYRIADCGYIMIENPDAKDGLWRVNGRRQAIYVHTDTPLDQRIATAEAHRDKLTTGRS